MITESFHTKTCLSTSNRYRVDTHSEVTFVTLATNISMASDYCDQPNFFFKHSQVACEGRLHGQDLWITMRPAHWNSSIEHLWMSLQWSCGRPWGHKEEDQPRSWVQWTMCLLGLCKKVHRVKGWQRRREGLRLLGSIGGGLLEASIEPSSEGRALTKHKAF